MVYLISTHVKSLNFRQTRAILCVDYLLPFSILVTYCHVSVKQGLWQNQQMTDQDNAKQKALVLFGKNLGYLNMVYHYWPRSREIMYLVASVLDIQHVGWPWLGCDYRSRVKGQGQMPKIVFWHHCYLPLRSRSKGRGKFTGQAQRSRSNFWCAAVDSRGAALPSAAKSNNPHYQSKVLVCVSEISRREWIIARMQSIGF